MAITRREALLSASAVAALSTIPLQAELQSPNPTNDVAKNDTNTEPVCLTDFEPLARKKMAPMRWEYMSAGAADELTLRWNVEAYQRLRLKPRVLVDVSHLDTRVTLFSQEHAFPILLAPVSSHKLAHPDGELATARGAAAGGITMVLSSFSNTSLEDVFADRPIYRKEVPATGNAAAHSIVSECERVFSGVERKK